jgi:hypothetical protein
MGLPALSDAHASTARADTAVGHWRGDTVLPGAWDGFSVALEDQVQNSINLYLPLKNPAQAMSLVAALKDAGPQAHEALASLRTVASARFVMEPTGSALWVMTVFDGDMGSYLMDFVGVLADVFDAILVYVHGAPPLPVRDHAQAYVEFVKAHSVPGGVHSAMPDITVMEALRLAGRPGR